MFRTETLFLHSQRRQESMLNAFFFTNKTRKSCGNRTRRTIRGIASTRSAVLSRGGGEGTKHQPGGAPQLCTASGGGLLPGLDLGTPQKRPGTRYFGNNLGLG